MLRFTMTRTCPNCNAEVVADMEHEVGDSFVLVCPECDHELHSSEEKTSSQG